MAASFPNAKKTFTAVVNGVTKLIATLFNSPYDEIEAVETMLGAMGSTQAYTDSYKNMLKEYRVGCEVEYKAVDEIYVRAGQICILDSSGNARFRVNPSDTTVDWGDIDTGAEENSTIYYVYALADASGTTFTVKITKSASLPSGATFYKCIGLFYNNSSGDIVEGDVANFYTRYLLGSWITRSNNTVYQAQSCGLVVAYNSTTALLEGITDSANPPTTVRLYGKVASGGAGITMPVGKGDYWKTTGADQVRWLSLG